MAQGDITFFDSFIEHCMSNSGVLTLMSRFIPARIKNKYARKNFYYIDAYISLVNEIEEVTSRSRDMAITVDATDEKVELGKRLYFHFYQRLHSYGGFKWDTSNFGIKPSQ